MKCSASTCFLSATSTCFFRSGAATSCWSATSALCFVIEETVRPFHPAVWNRPLLTIHAELRRRERERGEEWQLLFCNWIWNNRAFFLFELLGLIINLPETVCFSLSLSLSEVPLETLHLSSSCFSPKKLILLYSTNFLDSPDPCLPHPSIYLQVFSPLFISFMFFFSAMYIYGGCWCMYMSWNLLFVLCG